MALDNILIWSPCNVMVATHWKLWFSSKFYHILLGSNRTMLLPGYLLHCFYFIETGIEPVDEEIIDVL